MLPMSTKDEKIYIASMVYLGFIPPVWVTIGNKIFDFNGQMSTEKSSMLLKFARIFEYPE